MLRIHLTDGLAALSTRDSWFCLKTPDVGVGCLGRLPSPQDSARGHCAAGNKACDTTGASSPARLSVHRVSSKRTAPRAAPLSLSYLRLPSSPPLSLLLFLFALY